MPATRPKSASGVHAHVHLAHRVLGGLIAGAVQLRFRQANAVGSEYIVLAKDHLEDVAAQLDRRQRACCRRLVTVSMSAAGLTAVDDTLINVLQ